MTSQSLIAKWRIVAMGAVGASALLAVAQAAHAAPLSYPVDATISLSSPSSTLTVVNSSAASSVVVNASNIVVTPFAGSHFIVTTTSTKLTVTLSSASAKATLNCDANGGSIVDVTPDNTSDVTVTITSASGSCGAQSSASAGGGSSAGGGGGGGGGGSSSYAPPVSSTTTVATTTAGMASLTAQAQLTALQAKLSELLKQNGAQGVAPAALAGAGVFKTNLLPGTRGADVRRLQEFLIARAVGKAAQALKANGTTLYFGQLTKAAVREFQASVGISATGNLGPLTRAKIKALSQ